MLKTTTFEQLDSFFREKYVTEIAPVANFLTDFVSDNSKREVYDLTTLHLPNSFKRKRDLVILSVIHWYMNPEARFLFRLWLEENWCEEFIAEKAVLLSSKENALGYLLIQDLWSDSEFWGNVARVRRKLLPGLSCEIKFFRRTVKKARRKIRRRGYRDGKSGEYPRREKSVSVSYIPPENEWILKAEEFLILEKSNRLFFLIQERLQSERVC